MTDGTTLPVPTGQDDLMSFGSSTLDPGDLIMPRVKLLQAQSEEVADDTGKAGEFYNTLTSIVYGNELRFVPITYFKQRIFLVRSERRAVINEVMASAGLEGIAEGTQGLACRSYDMVKGNGNPGIACAECPLSQWDGDKPPLCSETYNVAAASEEGELIVLSFSKSSAKVGKQLLSMIRMRPGARETVFSATSKAEKGKLGNYFVPVIRPGDKAPPELIRQVQAWATQLRGVTIDVTPVDEDEGTPSDTGNDPF